MPGLVVEKGPDKGSKVKIEYGKKLVIGRDEGLPLQIHDVTTSRKHFRLDVIDSKIQLLDLDSRNGTYLNGIRIESPQICKIGDKIRIGETLFSILSDEEFSDPLIDQQVGGYLIESRLGKGGMGTVYQAVQVSLNRVVALKILSEQAGGHTKMSNAELIQQFIREAQAAGSLTHPNIVQIYDVGSAPFKNRELYYFSMEYCSQGSVQDILGRVGKIAWKNAIPLIFQAAQGLAYAEKKKIVHRDIKPDNLMMNEEGILKIGDLGLAKNLDEYSGSENAIFGTAHFVSPEQVQGKSVDHRADLYSLGATIFRIITGETLFSGKIAREIIMKQLSEAPRDPRVLDASIPEALALVVLKLLEKDPDRRYSSASILLEDLNKIDDRPPQIRLSSINHEALKQKATPLFLAVILVPSLLVLLFFILKSFSTENPEPKDHSHLLNSQQEEIARLRRQTHAQQQLSEKIVLREQILNSKPVALNALEDLLKDFQQLRETCQEFPELIEKTVDQQNFLQHEIALYHFKQIQIFCQKEEHPLKERLEKVEAFLQPFETTPLPQHTNFSVSAVDQAKKLLSELQHLQQQKEEELQQQQKTEQLFQSLQTQIQTLLQEKALQEIEQFVQNQQKEHPQLTSRLQELLSQAKMQLEKDFQQLIQEVEQFAQQQQFQKSIQILNASPFNQHPLYQRRIVAYTSGYQQKEELLKKQIATQIRQTDEENWANSKNNVLPLLTFMTFERAMLTLQQDRHTYQTPEILAEKEELTQHVQLLTHFKKQLQKAVSKAQNFTNAAIYLKGIFNFPKKTRFNIIGLDDEGRILLQQTQKAGKVTLSAKWEEFEEPDLIRFLYAPNYSNEKERYRYKLEIQDQLSLIAFLYQTRQAGLLNEEIALFEKFYSAAAQGRLFQWYKTRSQNVAEQGTETDERKASILIEEIEDLQILRKNKQAKELLEELKSKYSNTQAYKEFLEKQ